MIDLLFAKFWEATVVTFRVGRLLLRALTWSASAVLNRKQNQPPQPHADLLEPEPPSQRRL